MTRGSDIQHRQLIRDGWVAARTDFDREGRGSSIMWTFSADFGRKSDQYEFALTHHRLPASCSCWHLHMRGGPSIPILKLVIHQELIMDESSDIDMLTEMVKSRMFLEFHILAP